MTIAPTTCRFQRLGNGVAMVFPVDNLEILLTEAMAAALWQALGAAIGVEPMPSHGADDDSRSGGQEGGQ